MYKRQELASAVQLVHETFFRFVSPLYSAQGNETFMRFNRYENILSQYDHGILHFWGCFDGEKLVGVICIREWGHICMLFVDGDYHHRGIARRLFETAKKACLQENAALSAITVNASPYAVGAYKRLGFVAMDCEQFADGMRSVSYTHLDVYKRQGQRHSGTYSKSFG